MKSEAEILFDSIESAQEYLSLLSETVRDTRAGVEADIAADPQPAPRTLTLRMVSYNLAKLELHIQTSRRILNDLRPLRRMLLQQTAQPAVPAPVQPARRGPQLVTALNVPASDAKVSAA
ncbi:MAG TPA: hypothetical protein VES66_09360 [Terriglobales bacterium]|nr:hypothetical protein [Terriglobales bacterium]